ncbi:MAG TPA: hypothetical protein PK167_06065 [Prolixibacteraceae bacterium]|nr:hypothetical protein [Prolixibacteraceae bacterium]
MKLTLKGAGERRAAESSLSEMNEVGFQEYAFKSHIIISDGFVT